MTKKEGKELATVKVYLNTGIIAGLIGVGFIASTLVFGVLLLGLPETYIQCLPASSTFVLFNSQSDDDEIPRNYDASELFKYLSIKKRGLLLFS